MAEKLRPPVTVPEGASDTAQLMGIAREIFTMYKAHQAGQALRAPDAVAELPPDPNARVPLASVPLQAAAPAQPVSAEDEMNLFYTAFIGRLAAAARANEDVTQFASTILTEASDDFIDLILNKYNEAQALEWLATFNKDVLLFPEWFKRLRAKMKELDAENEPDPAA